MRKPAQRLHSQEQNTKSWHTTVLVKTSQLPPLGTDSAVFMANITNARRCSYSWKLGGASALPLT